MKAVILLNGEPFRGKIDDRNAYVYCCDGAYEWAKGKVRIDETLGDFDSLGYLPDPPPKEIFPSEKNETDGELALRRAIGRGFRTIELYGGSGKREDHFIGNLHLLYQALERGAHAELIGERSRIFAAEGDVVLEGEKGKIVSIAPFGGEAHIIYHSGFFYPLPERFRYGETIGISNVVSSDCARFGSKGKVLVFVNEREE
ncbi:MAG: thiamine diphosphokinase [Candidatus Gallimonas sp.]